VVSPCRGELTDLGELLGPVPADRLQRPVPGAARRYGDGEQALVRESGQPVDDLARLQRRGPAHPGGGRGGERRHEDRDPPQQGQVRTAEQGLAPVEHRPHRAVPLVGTVSAHQEPQVVGQTRDEPVEPECRQAGRGELDRQRHPVQLPANLGDPVQLLGLDGPAHRGGPIDKQRGGVRRTDIAVAVVVSVEGQRRNRVDPLEGHQEPSPAGCQHAHPWAARQQTLDERRHPAGEVLTVVQHQQGTAIGQGGQHRVVDAAALLLAKAERGRYRGADHRRIGDRHEVDEPHAVLEVAGQVRGDGQRQSGLARAAGAVCVDTRSILPHGSRRR
jgi:hypothetical protein